MFSLKLEFLLFDQLLLRISWPDNSHGMELDIGVPTNQNGLLFSLPNIFLTHINGTKAYPSSFSATLKAVGRACGKLRTAWLKDYLLLQRYPLVYNEGLNGTWKALARRKAERETFACLMAFYCIFNLKFPQALCFWCWEIAPVLKFPKYERRVAAIVSSPRFHVRSILCWMQSLL